MGKFINDYRYGKEQEDLLFELMKMTFDEQLKKSDKQFTKYDYHSDNYLIELKSRRNKLSAYTSTMIGKDKLDFASLNSHKKVVFVFNLEDGVYYWVYDKEQLGEIEFKEGGRFDRGKREVKMYAYINNNLLIKI